MDGFFDFIDLRTDEKKMTETRILGLDIETTGLDVSANEIIEIGIAEYDPLHRSITNSYQSLVKPDQLVKEHITRITGIDNDMLVGAPRISEIKEDIIKVITGSLLVIHNAEFDIPFLQKFLTKELLTTYDIAVFDTLKFSRKLLDSSRYSLEFLIESLGLGHEEHHRAVADARMCLKLFGHILDKRKDFLTMEIKEILKIIH